ncbi:MAG: glycerophosphodiester phosphodiesterase [Nitrosomonadales bacterium]|nr:glycerophosphodiester phosphodiesterase [Nitrosomonadales bacterium]
MTRTLIYAHRGANREAGENTRTAFDKALAYPIDGIETDVQLSRDEVAVLWHDRDLKKLKLPGRHIDDYDYLQLREMDFAAHFAEERPLPNPLPQAGEGANEALRAMPLHEGVMTLQDFIAAYRSRCRLLLEIKNRDWEQVSRHELKVRQTLALAGALDGRVLVSSFNLDSLVYAHGIAPAFPLVYNLEPEHNLNDARYALDEQPFLHGLCVHISTLDVDMMKLVRERGKAIAVYTCNTDAEIIRALTLGVDVLISDVPQKALQMRDK